MPGLVTLYTFYPRVGVKITVFRGFDEPEYITFQEFAEDGPISNPVNGRFITTLCVGVDQYRYTENPSPNYASLEIILNSTMCGYAPPTCDISIVSFATYNETGLGLNNGRVNIFAISSFGGIVYSLANTGGTYIDSNTTGVFTGLAPNDYIIKAKDSQNCEIIRNTTVNAYNPTSTNFKYRHQHTSLDGSVLWEARLYDMFNSYDGEIYPMDVKGTESPIIIKQNDPSEDKTTAIVSKNVFLSLWYDAQTFTTTEFTTASERQWKLEIYKDGNIEFIGWVVPDEYDDEYADPSYPFKITATDGLPSLKGNLWGDGSGGNGYSTSQIQQYGLAKWLDLVKQCLDQLGYSYGNLVIISSLQCNNIYNSNLWANIGTWSDIFYGQDNNPVDTYEALEILLKPMRLCIFQHKGRFYLVNWNDMYYLGNPLKVTEFLLACYEYNPQTGALVNTGISVQQPTQQVVGYNTLIKPINPKQSLNYDKAYNIKGDVDFDLLALLYPNPGFEIGPVQGQLPLNFQPHGVIDAYLNADPFAYDGDWVLRLTGHSVILVIPANYFVAGNYVDQITPFYVDQINKSVNLSFKWRPQYFGVADKSAAPAYVLYFQCDDGIDYVFAENDPDGPVWRTPAPSGFFFQYVHQFTEDYLQWNSFTSNSVVLPSVGTGYLSVRFYNPVAVAEGGTIFPTQGSIDYTVDIDDFEISLSDASEAYSKQTGETHLLNSVTGIPTANTKVVELKMFTYPTNKRVAGNLFTTTPYASGLVQNNWSFKLKSADSPDRLAAAVTKSIGRTYGRQMQKFEGSVKTNYLDFFAVYILRFYENSRFMPYSIELDTRNSTGSLILIEIDDNDVQAQYKYRGKFEKSARRNNN